MKDRDEPVLRYICDNDSDKGLYGIDIAVAVGIDTALIHKSLSALEREGLIESRWQNEAWPSGRPAPIEESEPRIPRRRYYRSIPGSRITLAEHHQTAQQTASGWGINPQPDTA